MILYLKTYGDTRYDFEDPLEYLDHGIGVVKLEGKIKTNLRDNTDLYLCCDIVESSYIGNKKKPILCKIERNADGIIECPIYNILFVKIIKSSVASMRLYITDVYDEIVSLSKNSLKCTLLIIPS